MAANCFALGTVLAAAQHTFVKKTIDGLENAADSLASRRRSHHNNGYRYSVAHPAIVFHSSTGKYNKT